MKIGVCDGRPRTKALELLKELTEFSVENEKIITKDENVTAFFVKPKDMAFLLNDCTIDVAIGFDDVFYHLSDKNYDLKPVMSKPSNTRVCLVKKKGKELVEPVAIVSEYQNVIERKSIFKRLKYDVICKQIVNGKAEHYVENDIVDACVTLVETGESLERSNLEICQEIYGLSVGIYVNVDNSIGYDLYCKYNTPKFLYIDGLDGSGKSTLVSRLKKDQAYRHYIVKDRSPMTQLTLVPMAHWPKKNELLGPDDQVWILDVSVQTCLDRIASRGLAIDPWETPQPMHYFYRKYMQLAMHYQLTVKCPKEEYQLNLKPISELEEVCRGESKIVYKLDDRFELLELIPSIYSHKKRRAGIVKESDICRLDMSRNLLDLVSFHGSGIDQCHNWIYIGNFDGYYDKDYILARHLEKSQDLPVEVVVKTKLQGSDKYRYTGLEKYISTDYPEPYVRLDWRNPNTHTEGDVCISQDLLSQTGYNCDDAKRLALDLFTNLQFVFDKFMDIVLDDMCFFITKDGTRVYSEISQDNARYKNKSDRDSFDKDVWRAGGSSDLILEKYKLIQKRVSDAHHVLLEDLNKLFY